MIGIVLAFGSNIGDREKNILNAYKELENIGINIICKSRIYLTKPYGVTDQNDFANSVVFAETDMFPEELLKKIKKTEKKLGRYETFRWGPRVIDIDIVFYDSIIYKSDSLIIPHCDYKNRDFVLEPLKEIKAEIKNINFLNM
ncbi:MAG: 2-amino-4-hydroxy-6-hydroxymethyldihydropteridine diphosphokinase [Armatimonadetes bacterium]|nr:2-amino-4-hydroxy-6-hydroxymethyldihydropteridine diphosphokinase [Candidatus Hippobium faecium]